MHVDVKILPTGGNKWLEPEVLFDSGSVGINVISQHYIKKHNVALSMEGRRDCNLPDGNTLTVYGTVNFDVLAKDTTRVERTTR